MIVVFDVAGLQQLCRCHADYKLSNECVETGQVPAYMQSCIGAALPNSKANYMYQARNCSLPARRQWCCTWQSKTNVQTHSLICLHALRSCFIVQVHQLVQRLLDQEHYALAVFVCRRMDLDDTRCWVSWAHGLVMYAHLACCLSAWKPRCAGACLCGSQPLVTCMQHGNCWRFSRCSSDRHSEADPLPWSLSMSSRTQLHALRFDEAHSLAGWVNMRRRRSGWQTSSALALQQMQQDLNSCWQEMLSRCRRTPLWLFWKRLPPSTCQPCSNGAGS